MFPKGPVAASLLICFALGFSSFSFAADTSQSTTENSAGKAAAMGTMSPAWRKDMADMYQKMADCLRTGQSSEDCQQQVAKDCPVVAKTGHCPILEGLGRTMRSRGMRPEGMSSMPGPPTMR